MNVYLSQTNVHPSDISFDSMDGEEVGYMLDNLNLEHVDEKKLRAIINRATDQLKRRGVQAQVAPVLKGPSKVEHALLNNDCKIHAIKALHDRTGCGFKDAKDQIEAWMASKAHWVDC